jgi:hypothetical protein
VDHSVERRLKRHKKGRICLVVGLNHSRNARRNSKRKEKRQEKMAKQLERKRQSSEARSEAPGMAVSAEQINSSN